jgi:Ca2+-transporting ATPase
MKPFHTLSIEEAYVVAGSSPQGLSAKEAAERLARNGKNALEEAKKKSLLAKFFDQLKDVMIIVLLAAAGVSAIIAIFQKQYEELIDSGIILLIVIVNAIVGLIQENKAEASMGALKNLNKPYAKVLRDGQVIKIKSEEIVVGDVVVLEAGDIVPADIRLTESVSLKIEEAALTGESVPVEKLASDIAKEDAPLGDRSGMCYSSGVVSYGRGQGIAVATGMDTEVGKIAKMLNETESDSTPLQIQLAKTAKVLSVLVLGIAVIIFGAAILRGLLGKTSADALTIITKSFMTAVAIAVAAIPEGLPAVVTIVLAIGVQRMSEKKAIVRNLPAVEALGCCEVICSDKTGTLTLNQMMVKELYTLHTGLYKEEETPDDEGARLLIRSMALCNDTRIADGKFVGDPTETALVAYAHKMGYTSLPETYPRIGENPFDSVRKLMSTVNKTEGGQTAHIKGAPDILLNHCSRIFDKSGIRPLTEEDVESILKANKLMATKALRVLGVAVNPDVHSAEEAEQKMVFVGLVGMMDPPRAEVKDAVAVCKKAGMRAIMITGDHADTAAAIAKDIGILEEGKLVVTGAELDRMEEREFMDKLSDICVYARVSPENKVRIVKAFKAAGKKVAMTGDGVNDAPSIKAADIGVGMGITGTDVSKGASDMVLADDNFATIVSAVEEGRKVYNNIKKAVQYLLSANIAEVLCLFIAIVFLNQEFLTPVMILWVNLVTDSLPALALGMEAAEPDIMNYPPRKSDASLFAGRTGRDILIQGLMQTLLVMASFSLGTYVFQGSNHAAAETMAFLTLCLIQLFHAYNMRSTTYSLFNKKIFANRFMNLAFAVGSILILTVVIVPQIGEVLFKTSSLTGTEWLISVGLAVLIVPMVEIQKWIGRLLSKKTARRHKI